MFSGLIINSRFFYFYIEIHGFNPMTEFEYS